MSKENLIREVVKCFDLLERIEKQVVSAFNEHYKICRHRQKSELEEEFFMNWECGHRKGNEHCCIMGCPASDGVMGTLATIHSRMLRPSGPHNVLVDKIFNRNISNGCKFADKWKVGPTTYTCKHSRCKNRHCCIVDCPLVPNRIKCTYEDCFDI